MYTLLVTGDVPSASGYFNPLLQQTIIPTTSGSKPGSPPDGMIVWETDTERYVTYNATLGGWKILGQIVDSTFTPTLTATTTNPTLGSGSTSTGRYTLRNGIWCDVVFTIKFGSSGAAAGSGQYLIAAPFTAANDISVGVAACGAAYLRDDSSGAIKNAMTYISPNFSTISLVADNTTVTNSSAWTWANLDSISGSISYRTNL